MDLKKWEGTLRKKYHSSLVYVFPIAHVLPHIFSPAYFLPHLSISTELILGQKKTSGKNHIFLHPQSKSYIPPAEAKASTPVVIPALDLAPPVAAPPPPVSVGGAEAQAGAEPSRKDVDMRRGRREGRGGDERGRGDGRSRSDKSGPRGKT